MKTPALFKCTGLLLAAVFLCACPKVDPVDPSPAPDPDPTPAPGPTPDPTPQPEEPYFKLLNSSDSSPIPNDYEIIINREPSGETLLVKTNIEDWTATSSESWCIASKDENGHLLVLVNEEYGEWNEVLPPRISQVQVKAGTVFDQTISVVQQSSTFIWVPQLPFDDALYSSKLTLSPAGESADVTVLTNCYQWIPSTEASWLTLSVTDISRLKVTSSARGASEAPRKAKVTLSVASDIARGVSFMVVDGDAAISGDDYSYGDHSDWD